MRGSWGLHAGFSTLPHICRLELSIIKSKYIAAQELKGAYPPGPSGTLNWAFLDGPERRYLGLNRG